MYGIVLDKSEGITVMYSVKGLDITEDVMRELRIKL
jgi:Skp family chaperone for outer membrane proteins